MWVLSVRFGVAASRRQREFRPGDVVIDILCAGGAPCVPVGHLYLGHNKLFIELVPLRHSE